MTPSIMPLGDCGLLVRFGDALTDEANLAAIRFAALAEAEGLVGVAEIVPNLISVLLRYDVAATGFERLAGEVRLLVSRPDDAVTEAREHVVEAVFDGEDLAEVAEALQLGPDAFIAAHNATPLRVLATGFAPGFVYCGMHGPALVLPRRQVVRRQVPPGTILFAAGQTAITSTAIPTGWHVIGQTDFRNFDPNSEPPVVVRAGEHIRFVSR